MRQDPSLVAYYMFQPAGDLRVLPNLSPLGSALDGRVEGAEWVDGRLPGKSALYFHGPNSRGRVVIPEQKRFNFTGPFSVAVWFRADRLAGMGMWQALITKGDATWRLHQDHGTNRLAFSTNSQPQSDAHPVGIIRESYGQSEVADGRWHLAVAVCEPAGGVARKRLYIDGRLEGDSEIPVPLLQNDEPVLLGDNPEWCSGKFSGSNRRSGGPRPRPWAKKVTRKCIRPAARPRPPVRPAVRRPAENVPRLPATLVGQMPGKEARQ